MTLQGVFETNSETGKTVDNSPVDREGCKLSVALKTASPTGYSPGTQHLESTWKWIVSITLACRFFFLILSNLLISDVSATYICVFVIDKKRRLFLAIYI